MRLLLSLLFIIARSYELAEERGRLGRSALNNPQKIKLIQLINTFNREKTCVQCFNSFTQSQFVSQNHSF